METRKERLDLALFGEEGTGEGAAPSAEGSAAAPAEASGEASSAQAGKGETAPRDKGALRAEFESLIKGEYKEAYDERVQARIRERFRQTRNLEEKVNALRPLAEALAVRYGRDAADVQGLMQALEADDHYLENEAREQGMTQEQLKRQKTLERENARYRRRAMEEQQRREKAHRIFERWDHEAQAAREVYNRLDLKTELNHPQTGSRFADLLRSGVDVRTAYEVIHKDEIIAGAMEYTARKVQEQTINDVRARGLRPTEAGGSGSAASRVVKTDPKTFTRKDRDEIARRVMRGERIEL